LTQIHAMTKTGKITPLDENLTDTFI